MDQMCLNWWIGEGDIIFFCSEILYETITHGDKNLHTLLVKHFNDLLDGQKSERSI